MGTLSLQCFTCCISFVRLLIYTDFSVSESGAFPVGTFIAFPENRFWGLSSFHLSGILPSLLRRTGHSLPPGGVFFQSPKRSNFAIMLKICLSISPGFVRSEEKLSLFSH
jgi:hypothetical protein